MLYPKITKTAKALPKKNVTNKELEIFLDTSDEWIEQRTGIKERRIAVEETTTSLSIEVAKQLVKDIDANSIDLIIVATMSADMSTPSVACLVQESIGAHQSICFDINAACSGFIYALSVVKNYLSGEHIQRALVIGTDVMSRLVDWSDRQTAVLFGDGSGGVLIEKTSDTPSFIGELIQADGRRSSALYGHSHIRQNRFSDVTGQPYLTMNGKQIFDFALRDVSKNMVQILETNNTTSNEIDFVLAHQANYRILLALSKKTGIKKEKFLTNVAQFGNTSAASIPILLDDVVNKKIVTLSGNSLCLLTGYGAGLTWGSLLIKL